MGEKVKLYTLALVLVGLLVLVFVWIPLVCSIPIARYAGKTLDWMFKTLGFDCRKIEENVDDYYEELFS